MAASVEACFESSSDEAVNTDSEGEIPKSLIGKDSNESATDSVKDLHNDKPSKTGMADVISKILAQSNKPSRNIINKGTKRSADEEDEFDGIAVNTIKKQKEATMSQHKSKERLIWEEYGHKRPSIDDKEKERVLMQTATRGVVQLFNAVRQQQKILEGKLEDAKGSVRKEEKALKSMTKGAFLDLLKGKNNRLNARSKIAKEKERPSWTVLQDDYMLGARMKDWDKEDNSNSDDGS